MGFWQIYFGPYEIVKNIPVRPWFSGVSRKFAAEANGIVWKSILDFVILYGLYFNFIDSSPLPGDQYGSAALYVVIAVANFLLARAVAPVRSSRTAKSVSAAIYAALVTIAVTGFSFGLAMSI
jgi:hypothetical protein